MKLLVRPNYRTLSLEFALEENDNAMLKKCIGWGTSPDTSYPYTDGRKSPALSMVYHRGMKFDYQEKGVEYHNSSTWWVEVPDDCDISILVSSYESLGVRSTIGFDILRTESIMREHVEVARRMTIVKAESDLNALEATLGEEQS